MMNNITESRIKAQIQESSGTWLILPEKESDYLCFELSFYEPVFSDTIYHYYSFEG